ncbi:MAG: chemotaxis protein CheW [Candidatus Korobacteraceae bacterium]|jgi:chemotaxis signal transduction protein
MTGERKFLLFSATSRQCAIPAEQVAELTAPSPVHVFPHGSREIAGVILRQGRVIPLYHLAALMSPADASLAEAGTPVAAVPGALAETRLQYQVIVARQFAGTSERAAFTVDGACDLVSAELLPANTPGQGVAGQLELRGKTYTVLNLDKLFSPGPPAGGAFAPAGAEAENEA